MRNPKQQAERWLKQAEHDLAIAQAHLNNSYYSDCCFMSEQTAQKAMKAFLYANGERSIPEHAIATLVKRAAAYDRSLQSLLEAAEVLDQYYIPTRYPDALAEPAVPFESYTKPQAAQALEFAQRIVTAVKQHIA